jgi:hypothetical protein
MFAIYAETVKAWIVQLQKNPDLLADGKIADATAKHASVLQKLDTRSRYLWGGGNAGGVCARRLAIFLEKHVKFLVGSGGPVFSAAHHSLHA